MKCLQHYSHSSQRFKTATAWCQIVSKNTNKFRVFRGASPSVSALQGIPAQSCAASFFPSVATCLWCPGAQHRIWESRPIHLILTVLPFWWMRTGLQWAYSEQRADGRRALNTSAGRQGIPYSSSRGFGTFLSISWSAGIKLWPFRSLCFPCIW